MARKKSQPTRSGKLSAALELEAGINLHKSRPLFSQLGGEIAIRDNQSMGKGNAAMVDRNGMIYLNQDYFQPMTKWVYCIAHCQLHLAFGHFDAERMPRYKIKLADGTVTYKNSYNKYLWNLACDIYISKFLRDIKFNAVSFHDETLDPAFEHLSDEIKIYQYLLERQYPEQPQLYGTASLFTPDMIGVDKPIIYDEKKNEKNEYAVRFVYALSNSVSDVISETSGYDADRRKSYTPAQKAAQWFINHYPLLGGLAANFQIIEDYQRCIQEEIQVAAVDVEHAEIYVNPAAGLNSEELKFVLAHEYLHAGLQHAKRCQGRDAYLWNVACDYVINGWLHDMHVGEMPNCGLYDESLKNISAESLYDRIMTDLKQLAKQNTLRGYGKSDILKGRKHGPVFSENPNEIASLDDFYRNALLNGLEYHTNAERGYIPAGLVEEIRALSMPPIPWDVELARWFDYYFAPLEKKRSYARPSRRQGSTPDIPRPSYTTAEFPEYARTFGVVLDTSGSMSVKQLGMALGAIASYAASKEVPFARVVFCDASPYDAGYLAPEDIAGRVEVKGRGGTILQPGIDLLESAKDFPKDGPILIITDGYIENDLRIKHEHAFLIPRGHHLPFRAKGAVFYFTEK